MIEVLCGRRYKSEECEINFLILWREYSCVCILQYTTVHTCTVNIWHGPRIMINFSTIIFCFADLHTRIADLFRQTFAINPHVTLVLSSNAYRLACHNTKDRTDDQYDLRCWKRFTVPWRWHETTFAFLTNPPLMSSVFFTIHWSDLFPEPF